MKTAVIVIGASYGDEGKGLAAFSAAGAMKGPVLDVLINGGAQRGHTVDLPDGRRHVFHHFGAGALCGADSLADRDFIVNPLLYRQEAEALSKDFGLTPRLLISDDCRVSLPYDMISGQIIEESRASKRHGSCGLGIFETRRRYETDPGALKWGKLRKLGKREYFAYCEGIVREYLPARLSEMNTAPDERWQRIILNPALMENSYEDLRFMAEHSRSFSDWPSAAKNYRSLVFEAGQGLLLDEMNKADFPHLTPSRTTSQESVKRILETGQKYDARVIYVSRSYLTRHGAGPFPTECAKEKINADMQDLTNVPNPHQETLRYGLMDTKALVERTQRDLSESRALLPELKSAILLTHLNETGGLLAGGESTEVLTKCFDEAYLSFSPFVIERMDAKTAAP